MLAHRIDAGLIEATLARARNSPRRRANHCFHAPDERLQRMVNVALRGSYFAPHRHRDPAKLEIFTILSGRALIAVFDDEGNVVDTALLADGCGDEATVPGPVGASNVSGGAAVRQVEIPPGAWHTLAVLSPEAVLYEVIDGYYDPATHKTFAPWAPAESDAEAARQYLAGLIRRCVPDENALDTPRPKS